MKKKIIFAVTTGIFALAMVFNMNSGHGNGINDVSLESIAVMAQAQGESDNGRYCSWNGYSRCSFNNYQLSHCPLYACRGDY